MRAFIFAIFFANVAMSAFAQKSDSRIDLHRQVATVTNLQGTVYTNVELVAATMDALVYSGLDGTIGQISFTNMDASTLERFSIPLDRIQYVKDAAQRRKDPDAREMAMDLAEQKKLLVESNLVQIRIESVNAGPPVNMYGGLFCCRVIGARGKAQIAYIKNMPSSVLSYFTKISDMQNSIAQLDNRIKNETAYLAQQQAGINQQQYAIRRADAVTPTAAGGDADFVNTAMAQRANVNMAQVNLDAKSRRSKCVKRNGSRRARPINWFNISVEGF